MSKETEFQNTRRKTRVEDLEEKIESAEKILKNLDKEFKLTNDDKEIEKLEHLLKEIQKMRNNIAEQSKKDEIDIEPTITKIMPQSLLLINNDKIRVFRFFLSRLSMKMRN